MCPLFGLIGHPVSHSFSPAMQNEWFRKYRLPHHYEAFDVLPSRLKEAVTGLQALGVWGFNVTVPHKIAVMEMLDDISPKAEKIGAVNTVKNENGKWIGYNTDGEGYLVGIRQHLVRPLSEYRVLIIGAGGAARAVALTLAEAGARRVDVVNRSFDRADFLARSIRYFTKTAVLTPDEAEGELGRYELIINTTPVGMKPNVAEVPLGTNGIQKGTILSDLIYNPLKTKWLREGEKLGAVIDNGLSMLVGQGALAFQIWTGIKPEIEPMKERLESIVRRRNKC